MKSLLGKLGVIVMAFVLAGCASKVQWTKPGFNPNEFKNDSYLCDREANILASQQAGAMSSAVNPLLIYAITKKKFFNNCMVAKGYQQFKSDKEKELIESLDKKIPDEREQITKPFETKTPRSAGVSGADWKSLGPDNQDSILYYDAESVLLYSIDILRVWSMTEYSDKGVLEMVKELGERYKTLGKNNILIEINCAEKKFRFLQEIYYSKTSNIIDSRNTPNEWMFFPPDSFANKLHKKVCIQPDVKKGIDY